MGGGLAQLHPYVRQPELLQVLRGSALQTVCPFGLFALHEHLIRVNCTGHYLRRAMSLAMLGGMPSSSVVSIVRVSLDYSSRICTVV